MSDWNPNQYDKYGNLKYDAPADNGRSPYILLAILVLIGLVGGALYIDGKGKIPSENVATAPARERPVRPIPGPGSVTPAPSVTPSQPAQPMPPDNPPTPERK